jgi:hypothetical protein
VEGIGPDTIVERTVRALGLDRDWIEYVETQARTAPEASLDRCREVEAYQERVRRDFHAGRTSEETWARIFDETQRELAALPKLPNNLAKLGQRVKSFAELWDGASAEAKNQTCRVLFEEVILNMRAETVEFTPWPEFRPLFDARAHYVTQTVPGPNTPNVNGARRAGLYTLEELGVVA